MLDPSTYMTKKSSERLSHSFFCHSCLCWLGCNHGHFRRAGCWKPVVANELQENKQSRCTFKYEFWFLICPTISCRAPNIPKSFFLPAANNVIVRHKFHHAIVYSWKTEQQIQTWARMTTKHLSSVMLHTSTIFHASWRKCVVQIGSMKICQQHWQPSAVPGKRNYCCHCTFDMVSSKASSMFDWQRGWFLEFGSSVWFGPIFVAGYHLFAPTNGNVRIENMLIWTIRCWRRKMDVDRYSLQAGRHKTSPVIAHHSQKAGWVHMNTKLQHGMIFCFFFLHTFFPQKVCSRGLF